jgi:hypothetical protein
LIFNTNLLSSTNSHENDNFKKAFVEELELAIKPPNSTNREIQFNQYTSIIIERLKKRGVVYRSNNESTRGDCDFFDCEGQEACGYESWLGDDVCDDGTYGIFYNCDEFDNDNGDCDVSGDSGGADGGVVDPCKEIGGTTSWLGDGWCDTINNNNECGYDAGDCCPSTCVDAQYDCSTYGGSCDDCIDPSAEDSNGGGSCTDMGDDGGGDAGSVCEFFDCSGQEACGYEDWVGDGYCDDGTWGIFYNCDEFNNDEGDCDIIGDDGGDDIGSTCEFFDCSGQEACGYEDWVGDEYCDDGTDQGWAPILDFNCEEYDFDGGECDGTGDDGAGEEESVLLSIGEAVVVQGEMPGEGILYGAQVPLYYESFHSIGGIQFNMSDSPDWVVGIEVNSVISDCFDVSFNDVNGGLIAIFFSLDGCEIDASEASTHFANLTYELSTEAEWGSQVDLNFHDVIISNGVGNTIPFNTQGGIVNVSLLGDVSSDSEINVIDVVTAINFILLLDIPSEYQAWAGDINGDTAVNILDIVMLVDIILER